MKGEKGRREEGLDAQWQDEEGKEVDEIFRTNHEISIPPRPQPLFIDEIQLVEMGVKVGNGAEIITETQG